MANTQPPEPLHEDSRATVTKPGDGVAHVGRPLDGAQYLDVVEEQEYANQRPGKDENRKAHEKR